MPAGNGSPSSCSQRHNVYNTLSSLQFSLSFTGPVGQPDPVQGQLGETQDIFLFLDFDCFLITLKPIYQFVIIMYIIIEKVTIIRETSMKRQKCK